jgi:ABC-type oligopeptide transport system substrate-binding subunit
MDNHLTGLPVCDSGGLVIKGSRVTFPTSKYVANFGFGAGRGTIDASKPMDSTQEPVAAWQSYFHEWSSDGGTTMNDMNDDGSASSDLRGNVAAGYYNTRLNSAKDGYEWYPLLASAEPIPLTSKGGLADETLTSSRFYRFKVHTGGDYKYATLSKTYSAYNGREIALEDYVTPVKAMLNNQWYRKGDMAKQFAGVEEYNTAVAAAIKTGKDLPDWSTVGFQANATENSIDVEFVNAKSRFNAKYAISDDLYSPFPQAWLDAVTPAKAFLIGDSTTDFYANVDNIICTGVYVPEYWESGKSIVFKKNASYIEADAYHYDGTKIETITGDGASTTAFKKFLTGSLDYTGIPSAYIDEYVNDPRTLHTLGSSVENLQVDSCTAEEWEKYYGPNGTVYPHAKGYTGYTVKPILSNDTFLDGIYFSFNRQEFADKEGTNPAQAYLSDAYMVDPEKGMSYRSTAAAKRNVAERSPETIGYNEELAAQLFKKAADEEIAAGHYKAGDTIKLNSEWRTVGEMNISAPYFKKWIETAWNKANTGITLEFTYSNPSTDYRVAYYDMLQGQCDFMFGSITGSALDPLGFMDTLCTDGRDLTLSRGADTSIDDGSIVFDSKTWSYDALWSSTQGGTIVQDGCESVAVSPRVNEAKTDYDISYDKATHVLTLNYNYLVYDGLDDFAIKELYIDTTDGATGGGVYDYEGYYNEEGGSIDLGTNGTYDDGVADANAPEISTDGKGKLTVTLDLTNYLADSRFSAASATGDEAKDPKQIWFRLTYTANAQGSVVGGKVGYSNDYSVKTLFGL